MEEENIGMTVNAKGYEPDNFTSWAVLEDKYSDQIELQEPGIVYEILEEREDDACYGIVNKAIKSSDTDLLSEAVSLKVKGSEEPKKPLEVSAVNLNVFRKSGITSPTGRHGVRVADASGIRQAFNISEDGIPLGVYSLLSGVPSSTCVVRVPSEYLLGPEAAHYNIGGQSGYGKTALTLLCSKAILSDDELAKKSCVVAFNVKKDDLLWPDYENPELTGEDKKLYDLMELNPEPFTDTKIFAPQYPERREKPNSLREDATPFSWEWKDVKNQLYLAISPDDWDDRLEALLAELVSDDTITLFGDAHIRIENLITGSRGGWAGRHHLQTVQKTRRIMYGLVDIHRGLLRGEANPLPVDELLVPGRYSVIDVQRLRPPAQKLVFSKVYEDTSRTLEEGKAEVEKVIYIMDELNKFAPREARVGPIAGIKSMVDEMAERGRSIGTIQFGIQQYPSMISDSVTGNVATFVYSRMKATELTASLYRGLVPETKQIIQRLQKGYAVADHDTFSYPVVIRYPRPPCAQTKPE